MPTKTVTPEKKRERADQKRRQRADQKRLRCLLIEMGWTHFPNLPKTTLIKRGISADCASSTSVVLMGVHEGELLQVKKGRRSQEDFSETIDQAAQEMIAKRLPREGHWVVLNLNPTGVSELAIDWLLSRGVSPEYVKKYWFKHTSRKGKVSYDFQPLMRLRPHDPLLVACVEELGEAFTQYHIMFPPRIRPLRESTYRLKISSLFDLSVVAKIQYPGDIQWESCEDLSPREDPYNPEWRRDLLTEKPA